MRTRKQTQYMGIKMSPAEEAAIIQQAEIEGISKSTYARKVLRSHLIKIGSITIRKPATRKGVIA